MQLSLVSAFLALGGIASCSPHGSLEARDMETVLYKRGETLDKRGYELAELHGVDVTQMYRHSLVKRSDGDDVTIWVHNSYSEDHEADEPESLIERAVKLTGNAKFKEGGWWAQNRDACGKSSFTGLTSSSQAFTGGVNQIRDWGRSKRGGFHLIPTSMSKTKHTHLLVAGSNSGANARFMVKPEMTTEIMVGTKDIGDLAYNTLYYRKTYNGKQRVAAKGDMKCLSNNAQKKWVNWRITK